jgi:hypothetical protein
MSARHRDLPPEPFIIELDGPPMAFFEIPLDYWATPNGELEAEGHPQATRLTQRILYQNFVLVSPNVAQIRDGARIAVERVRTRLKELGGGYIWWRKRPTEEKDGEGHTRMRFRLGTTPELPIEWWRQVAKDVGNQSQDPLATDMGSGT